MIRPVSFSYNTETAVNNAFQVLTSETNIQQKARKQFDDFVKVLQAHDIDVLVINDTPEPYTPDSIFPNNWISFHADGAVVLYPMFAQNRRLERKPAVLNEVNQKFEVSNRIDLTENEQRGQYLEGTGSMVLDRENRIAYACVSPRTDPQLLEEFCKQMGYRSCLFTAVDKKNHPIYHTNVMMCVADRYAVVCLECIPDKNESQTLVELLGTTGKHVIPITMEQVKHFAGNMLQVENRQGKKFVVMSTQAFESLNSQQIAQLVTYNEIIHSPLDVIETSGGGSARCMIAEIHLPVKHQGLL